MRRQGRGTLCIALRWLHPLSSQELPQGDLEDHRLRRRSGTRALDFLMPVADVSHARPSRAARQPPRKRAAGVVLEDSSEFLMCEKDDTNFSEEEVSVCSTETQP